jgi:hypothetical protein
VVLIPNFQQHSIALVIPDHSDKQYIEAMIKVLFQYMGFRQVGILQVRPLQPC